MCAAKTVLAKHKRQATMAAKAASDRAAAARSPSALPANPQDQQNHDAPVGQPTDTTTTAAAAVIADDDLNGDPQTAGLKPINALSELGNGKGSSDAAAPADQWKAFLDGRERDRDIAFDQLGGGYDPAYRGFGQGEGDEEEPLDPYNPEDVEFRPDEEEEEEREDEDLAIGDPEEEGIKLEKLSPKARRMAKLAARRRAKGKGKGKERAVGSRGDKGFKRSALCLNCLKSTLASKMEEGDWCFDTEPAGNRCYKCASGHSCGPIPSSVVPFAGRFLAERKKEMEEARDLVPPTPGSKREKKADLVGRWRVATKLAIELAEERAAAGHADQPNADLQGMTSAELEAAGRAASVRSWDAMALLARRRSDKEV